MDQGYPATGNTAAPKPMERDEEMLASLRGSLNEAAERVTFHECERERWLRIGRASARGLETLQAVAPIAQTTAESFAQWDQPQQAVAESFR
jgi:hypothetical protein